MMILFLLLQLIELLSVRAPPAEKKLTLLKEIAEEHGVDWDPAESETELFKSHEDLLVSQHCSVWFKFSTAPFFNIWCQMSEWINTIC